jgi:hypothetical protein
LTASRSIGGIRDTSPAGISVSAWSMTTAIGGTRTPASRIADATRSNSATSVRVTRDDERSLADSRRIVRSCAARSSWAAFRRSARSTTTRRSSSDANTTPSLRSVSTMNRTG